MATIHDVAEEAGVSVKTVSRVMNDYEHVSEKTRDRVRRAIAKLGYHPQAGSRQGRADLHPSIGMLYGDPSGGYQSRLNHAVLKACSDAGRYLAVEYFDEKKPEWRQQVEDFLDRTQVKNLILVPPMCDSEELHDLLRVRQVRTVLISPSRQMQGAISIAMDDRLAAKQITQHLIDLGHTHIAHIMGDDEHVASLLRRQGFEEAVKRAELPFSENNIVRSNSFLFKDGVKSAEKLLATENRPTAIFAANDEMAAAVIMTANRLGLSVPGELSVVGFDDTPISRTIWPELTTIAQPFNKIASEAVRLLSQKTERDLNVSETRVLPHKLLVRDSTAPLSEMNG